MQFMRRIIPVFVFIAFFTATGYAQREANVWYFGRYLGLDFNSGVPVALNDGVLNTTEGVATISNSAGNLQFYTEGTKVWNRFHQVMPNGTGLFGSFTSSQSAIIVPKIGDTTRYYVFTVDAESGPRGLNYSIVNMTLDGGRGDIELKNVPLQLNVVEKVTAVRHCNNRDIWVVTHGAASDIYYSFLVSSSGINTTPVISHSGSVLPGVVGPSLVDSSSLGYLKASPDGKKMAAAHWTVNADVSDFNNATGVVSNTIKLFQPGDPHYLVYGIEFSPDSKLLYTTVFYVDPANAQKRNALFQYDVSATLPSSVIASKQLISQTSDPIQVYAALQIGPDNKMYMAKNVYKHIACINNPNVYGTGCNFVSNAIQWTLPNQESSFGLPTFVQSYFYPVDSFNYNSSCDLNVNFNYTPRPGVLNVQWNFGDPSTGVNNTSTLNNPSHIFSAAGTYNVMLIKFTNCGPDTLKRQVITNGLAVNLGNDTTVCGGTSLLLSAASSGATNNFLWQDGSTNPTLMVTATGQYWVQVSNAQGCIKKDTINISFKALPVFNLGADQSICAGDTLLLNATTTGATSYLWQNGNTTSTTKAYLAGLYWCEVNNGGCVFRDSLTIAAVKPIPLVNLGNDQVVCQGNVVNLDATYLTSTYLWQNGSTGPVLQVSNSGIYYVQVTYNGCKKSDTISINYTPKPSFTLGPDQYICPGNKIILTPVLNPSWQINWQDGTSTASYSILQPGTYRLSASNNCGTTTDDIVISTGLCKVYVPNGFTPNNDGRNDLFKAFGTESVSDFELTVFERGGQVIYQTRDKSRGWDGKIKGVPFSSGVFIYMIRYRENGGDWVLLKGTVALIR